MPSLPEQPAPIAANPGRALAWAWAAALLAGVGVAFVPWMLVALLAALAWLGWGVRRALGRAGADLAQAADRLGDAARERERHERIRRILDAAGTPILATDARGVITAASRSASRTIGAGRPLAGVRFDELLTQPELHELERHARAGEPGRARVSLPIEGELRTLVVSADPLEPDAGCVVTLRDVTELIKAADLKADFAANASHELRTPIASIRAAAETLQGPARSDPAMLERLTGMIGANAARLEALVNDLLDLSRLESGDTPPALAEVDLHAVIDQQREQFEPICRRKSLRIEADLDPAARTVRTDPVLLELILRNLIENALKFTRPDTAVTVTARPASVPADPVNPPPPGADRPDGLCLAVRDRGPGIPLGQQQRIFERFYQVDRARAGGSAQRGTGLGLAIVKHAARRLGGSVRVDSVYEQGATMIVELPNCVGDPGGPTAPPPSDAR